MNIHRMNKFSNKLFEIEQELFCETDVMAELETVGNTQHALYGAI